MNDYNEPVCIYALFDPRSPNKIRYVGKSQELIKRIRCHISKTLCNQDKTYKAYWIAKLKSEEHKLTNLTDGGEVKKHKLNIVNHKK